MKTLQIILSSGKAINYETKKKKASTALKDWEKKVRALGLCRIPMLEHFLEIKNALLLDENGFIEDYIYNPLL